MSSRCFALTQLDAVAWLRSLEAESLDLVITDPPYESLEKDKVVHFISGEVLAEVSRSNGALVERDHTQSEHDIGARLPVFDDGTPRDPVIGNTSAFVERRLERLERGPSP
jgi:DNA modification methylase